MKKILAVDDDEAILELVHHALEIEDTEIFVASNAQDAIRLARLHSPQVVLLDLMMPEYDGFELFSILREVPDMQTSRFIMFTAQGNKSNLWESIDMYFSDFIAKPFDLSELEIRIRHQLQLVDAPRVRR